MPRPTGSLGSPQRPTRGLIGSDTIALIRATCHNRDVADLSALRELYAWMREERILYARSGDLELRLEALPPPATPIPEPTAEDVQREAYRDLLYSADEGAIEAILSMTGKA